MASSLQTSLTQVGETALKRFVVHAGLLWLIDPVRGTPTRATLDDDPNNHISGGQELKLKFLDSFALICSTSKFGKETASAVCLEQHDPSGFILRVARNRGLNAQDLAGLEGVLNVLRIVSKKEKTSAQAEPEILRLVVELDKCRILSMADRAAKRGLRGFVQELRSGSLAFQFQAEMRAHPGLGLWLENCPFTDAAPYTWNTTTVALLIDWASQARWLYSKQLENLIGPRHKEHSAWLNGLHKIARYHSAIKSMVKLAVKQPEVFANIKIQGLKAPDVRPFSIFREKSPVKAAVQNLVREESEATMGQLEKHLGMQDVESQLRKACRLDLTLHAEMQLIVFYEGNPGLTPKIRFIGTSKKACFLCHEYLLLHPLKLQVSACHQKIYPSWMPPPYYPISGKFKSPPFSKLSRKMEQWTKRDLRDALNAPRRLKNQDSTAGPALTVTATAPTGLTSLQATWKQFGLQGRTLSQNA